MPAFVKFISYPVLGIFLTSLVHRMYCSPHPPAADMDLKADNPTQLPTYFLSIGGPNFMENTDHPAYSKLAEVGEEITTKLKPKAVVVFSAHWQSGANTIQVNVAEKADIIYDFYGFPPHYYQYTYPNKGSPEIAENVIERLTATGIEVERTRRGLDHGVWVGFIAAFNPQKNPLNVPIVQVSLYGNDDPDAHYRLGQALEGLRSQGVLIVGAGMAVHNLPDFRASRGSKKTMPYSTTFDDALEIAVTGDPEQRKESVSALIRSDIAQKAHPTLEHIMPMAVVAGAAGQSTGKRLWTFPEGSLNWAQYRFGSV